MDILYFAILAVSLHAVVEVVKVLINAVRATKDVNTEVLEIGNIRSIILKSTYLYMLPVVVLSATIITVLSAIVAYYVSANNIYLAIVHVVLFSLTISFTLLGVVSRHINYMEGEVGNALVSHMTAQQESEKDHPSEEWFS